MEDSHSHPVSPPSLLPFSSLSLNLCNSSKISLQKKKWVSYALNLHLEHSTSVVAGVYPIMSRILFLYIGYEIITREYSHLFCVWFMCEVQIG